MGMGGSVKKLRERLMDRRASHPGHCALLSCICRALQWRRLPYRADVTIFVGSAATEPTRDDNADDPSRHVRRIQHPVRFLQ